MPVAVLFALGLIKDLKKEKNTVKCDDADVKKSSLRGKGTEKKYLYITVRTKLELLL